MKTRVVVYQQKAAIWRNRARDLEYVANREAYRFLVKAAVDYVQRWNQREARRCAKAARLLIRAYGERLPKRIVTTVHS